MPIISEEIMKKIDAHRGNLSYAEFIDFAVDRAIREAREEVINKRKVFLTKKWEPENVTLLEKYITQEELDEFILSIKGILKTFIDFFITYDMELNGRPTMADSELVKTVCSKHSRSVK